MGKSSLQSRAIRALLDLGVNPSHRGFDYLKDAVVLVYEEPTLLRGAITKTVYPTVAKMNSTTGIRAERCIRHSVEWAIDNSPDEVFKKYFGNCLSTFNGKLTNSAFIAGIVKFLKMEDEEVTDEAL